MRSTTKLLALLLTVMMLMGSVLFGVFAAPVEDAQMADEAKILYNSFKDKLVKTEVKDDGHIGIPVHLYMYTDGNRKQEVIFYVINHAADRIGQESDLDIVGSYIEEGYVVIVVDYLGNEEAVSPDIEHSLAKLRTYFMVEKTGFSGTGLSVKSNYAYFLPAGYRLARDIVYREQDKHASYGTLNHIMDAWNGYIAGQKTVSRVEDCRKKDGSPMDYRLRMDIVYPSEPLYETPVYAMAATQAEMHMHTCEDNSCHFVGFAFNGYTSLTFDFVYVPMARADHYGYFSVFGTYAQNASKMARAGG